jgi:hypothetical protein
MRVCRCLSALLELPRFNLSVEWRLWGPRRARSMGVRHKATVWCRTKCAHAGCGGSCAVRPSSAASAAEATLQRTLRTCGRAPVLMSCVCADGEIWRGWERWCLVLTFALCYCLSLSPDGTPPLWSGSLCSEPDHNGWRQRAKICHRAGAKCSCSQGSVRRQVSVHRVPALSRRARRAFHTFWPDIGLECWLGCLGRSTVCCIAQCHVMLV